MVCEPVPEGYGLVAEGRIRGDDLVFDPSKGVWLNAREFDLKGAAAVVDNVVAVARQIWWPSQENG